MRDLRIDFEYFLSNELLQSDSYSYSNTRHSVRTTTKLTGREEWKRQKEQTKLSNELSVKLPSEYETRNLDENEE